MYINQYFPVILTAERNVLLQALIFQSQLCALLRIPSVIPLPPFPPPPLPIPPPPSPTSSPPLYRKLNPKTLN